MMDNQTGSTPVRLIMAQIPNSGVQSSEQYVQLPSMQQLVSHNAKQTLIQPMMSPQAENQTVVQLPSMQQLISQTAKPAQVQQMMSPPAENQTIVQQAGSIGGQPIFPGQIGIPSVLNQGGMYAANYQLVPRNYAVVNQGVHSAGIAVQMSPQGATTLSPGEQFIQPTGFDQQLTNFSNSNNQFAFQNQNPQMLQSPNHQFGVQAQNLGQINPGIIAGGQGHNIFLPGQGQGMIFQGQTMLPQNTSTIFHQNPGLNSQPQIPGSQNVNMQSFGNNGQVVGQLPSVGTPIIQSQVPANYSPASTMNSPNSPAALLSPNSTRSAEMSPTPVRKRKPSGQKSVKAKQQHDASIQLNSQLQFLTHLANQSQVQQSILTQNPNAVNFGNLGQNPLLANLVTQNQTLPSFGHFLLHQHQQQQQQVIPHLNSLGLQQAPVNMIGPQVGGQQISGATGAISQNSVTNLVGGQSIPNIFTGQNFPCHIAGAPNVPNNNIMQLQGSGVNFDPRSQIPGANLNIDVNSWNSEQFANLNATLLQGHSGPFPFVPGGIQRFQQSGPVRPTVPQTKPVQPKCVSCVSKTTDTITMSNIVRTRQTQNVQDPKSTSVTNVTFGVSTISTSKILSPKGKCEPVCKAAEVECKPTTQIQETEVKLDLSVCKNVTNPNSVVVPFGWLRLQEGQSIVYYSPSFVRLTSYQTIKQYLSTEGTCKCGLECPILVEKVFNFDLNVSSMQWTVDHTKMEDIGKLCNHRRKIVAMVSFQQNRSPSTLHDSLTVKNVIMSPRVSSTVQEKVSSTVQKTRTEIKTEKEPDKETHLESTKGLTVSTDNEIGRSKSCESNSKSVSNLQKGDEKKFTSKEGKDKNRDKIEGEVKTIGFNKAKENQSIEKYTGQEKVLCDMCKENIQTCGCDRRTNVTCTDIKSTEMTASVMKPDDSKATSRRESKEVPHNRQAARTTDSEKSDASNLTGSEIGNSGKTKTMRTNSKSIPHGNLAVSPSEKANSHGVSHADSLSANAGKSNPTVTLSSIKKLVSQVSQKIATENLSSGQKSKSFGDNVGMLNSSVRPALLPCHVGSFLNNLDNGSDKRVLLNSPDRLDTMRDSRDVHESANFNQLLLSNMLKLTSPPNQQVFPNQHSFPPIPVQGMIQGYRHGALPNTGPVFSQIPMHNIPRFTVPNSEVGQALGNVMVNHGNSSFPDYANFPWMNRKAKVKRAKSKKEKKIPNLFESESPPPNVDVSKLKDKGHGHIPKQRIASFLENPSEFMEQQTALVNSSISSTSPSPKAHSEIDSEVCEPPKRSESVDSDRLTVIKRSDSVNSDRISSPNKDNDSPSNDKGTDLIDEVVSENVTSNEMETSSIVTSKEESLSASVETINPGVPKKEENVSLDAVENKTPASIPPTPSAVVHHPPEVSQTSTSQSRSTDEKNKPVTVLRQSTPHPFAAMLNHPGTNQAFQQMFPNVVQEALLQSVGFCSDQNSLLLGQAADSVSAAKPVLINSPPDSTKHMCNPRGHIGRPIQTPIRQVLENQNKDEFPASNLLSAAAKAQLLQQQNQLNSMLAQQLNGEICNPFYNPQMMSNIQGPLNYGPVNVNVEPIVSVANTLTGQPTTNTAFVASGNSTEVANDRTQLKQPLASTGTSKISELLNKSNSMVKKPTEVSPMPNKGDKCNSVENPTIFQQQCNSEVNKIANVPNQQLHMPNSINHPVSNVNISQQMLNQQQLMQMFSAMGFPFMPTGQFDMPVNHLNTTGLSGQIPTANTQLLHNQDTAIADRLGSNQPSCHPVSANNAQIQPFSVPVNSIPTAVSSDKTTSIGSVQGNAGSQTQFQGAVLQNPNLFCPTNMQEQQLNMLGVGCSQSGSPAFLQGFKQVAADVNMNVDRKLDQQSYPSTEASVVVMQNGIPMIQMVAPNQISINSNADKTNMPHLTLSSQGVGIQPLVQNNSQCTVSTCQPIVPLNLINVQQSWNNGNTNLTAMQLQTLQLQQQLLHQIQQVQGMQSLINNFNLQGLSNNSSPVTSSMQGSIPIPGVPMPISSHINSSSESVPPISNPVAHPSDRRQTAACALDEASENVSSCVITSTVKSSRPDSVSTTCSLQSECHDNLMTDKVSVAAADTTQGSPVQCKSSTARTVDIGTETEAFDDGEDEDDDDESNEENESNDESVESSEKEVKEVSDSESELEEPSEKQVKLESKQTPSRTSSAKSCYSLALASVTAQRNRSRETESLKSSRKRYYSSTADFTTVKSESSDKRLKLVIRKRTGLSPVKTSVDDSTVNDLKSLRLKIHRKQSVCETITNLYSKRDAKIKPKKRTEKQASVETSAPMSESSSTKTVTENIGNKLKTSENSCTKTKGQDKAEKHEKDKYKGEDVNEKFMDCDSSSSIEDVTEHASKSSVLTSVDESEPSTTVSDTECSIEKERKQNELTFRIAAALTVQKGRWHLTASPKKLKHDTDTTIVETPEKDVRGVKRSKSLLNFENCEDVQDGTSVSTTSHHQSFHIGDLVWGQIRGFPSWPGKLVDSDYKLEDMETGKLLVRWFGDHTLTQVEPGKLKTLSEGLEAHHRARKKHRKGRKMNTNLEQAIQEAMAELDRQTAESEDITSDKDTHKYEKRKKATK